MFAHFKLSTIVTLAISMITVSSVVHASAFPRSATPADVAGSAPSGPSSPGQLKVSNTPLGSPAQPSHTPATIKPQTEGCPAPPSSNCAPGRSYTVQASDSSCDQIANDHQSSSYQIVAANKGVISDNCGNLQTGMQICLGLLNQDCQVNAQVSQGQICSTIATNAGITTDLLLKNNPNIDKDCFNLYAGEVLCTANTQIPYSS